MKLSQYIEHLKERLAENGDHDLVFPDNTDVEVPDFDNDPVGAMGPAFVLDHPA